MIEEQENFELEQEIDGIQYEEDLPLGMENDEEPVVITRQEDMIDQILDGDLTSAEGSFQDILSDKMNDLLNSKQVELANTVYNGVEDIADPTYTADELEVDAELGAEDEIETPGDEISDESTDSIET